MYAGHVLADGLNKARFLEGCAQFLATPGMREEFARRFGPQPGPSATAAWGRLIAVELTIDLPWLLELARTQLGDPDVTDWGALEAARARRCFRVMDDPVYDQPHHRGFSGG